VQAMASGARVVKFSAASWVLKAARGRCLVALCELRTVPARQSQVI